MRLQSARKSAIKAVGPQDRFTAFIAFFTLAVVTLLFPSFAAASATNIYLAQNAAGAANGSDCADALPYTFFNNSGNWGGGANQIGPGTTVHLCGIISGPNPTSGAGGGGKNVFTFQGSGNSGGSITLHWENGAILKANYFGEGGGAAIAMNGKSYIVIDGGANGIIENTANGTSGSAACPSGSCSNQQPATFIQATCGTNCEIKNLTLGPDYLRTAASDGAPAVFGNEAAIFVSGSGSSNLLIHDNIVHDGRWILTFEFGTGSNFQFYNNTVYGAGHAIAVEIGSNSTYTGMYFYGNHIYDFTPWAGNSAFHNNAIHVFQSGANSTGTILGLYIYNNEFDGSFAGSSTNSIYLEPNGSVKSVGTGWIFNNVLTFAGDETGGDGILGATAGGTSMFIANNTLIGNASNYGNPNESCGGSNQPLGSTTWTGNIAVACSLMWGGTTESNGGPNFAAGQPNYNLWADGVQWACNSTWTSALSTWQGCIGNETHSAYSAVPPIPPCNNIHDCSNVRPASGSKAIGFAANLYSTCNGRPIPGLGALCYDKPQSIGPGSGSTVGSPRSTTNAWDAGAYASGVSVSQPPAPAGLVAVVN